MNLQYIFPVLQIGLCMGASVVYFLNHDHGRCVYWASAALITTSVTFWVR